jgi:hypothetical protein
MRLIDADALKERILKERDAIPKTVAERYSFGVGMPNSHGNSMRGGIRKALRCMEQTPTIDPKSLRPKGRWKLEVKSFYRDTFDESCELVVYILATCSCCGGKHPNSYQVYSKNLYAPEYAEEDYRFDETAEMEKALAEFRDRNYVFANYCPNCGADMREG